MFLANHKGVAFRRQIAVVAFYLLLACMALYWPLFHATTHVPGNSVTDYFHFHWNYWWIRHALTTPGLNVYETNFVMFPATSNLAYHTLTPFWFPVWAVVEPFFGTIVAFYVIIVTAMTLIGWTFYLLLRRENVPAGLALVGGAALQLTPSVLGGAVWSDLNYVSFFWVVLQLVIWSQVVRSAACGNRRWRGLLWALIQGISFYAMGMTDLQYPLYSIFLLVPYGVLTLIEARTSAARLRLILLGTLALVVMIVLLWFVGPLPYMLKFDRAALAPPPAENVHSLPFPAGYFLHFDDYRATITLGSFVVPSTLLTFIASLTVLRGKVQDRRRWFWFVLAIVPLILSAGARITIAGMNIQMPYVLVHDLLGRMFRSPERFGTVFIIPAMIFNGRTWRSVLTRRLMPGIAALLMLVVLVDARLFLPMQIQELLYPYTFYAKMGQERGKLYDDYVVLEVPVAAGSGEYSVGEYKDSATEWYGITHGKRMVNGLISRVPTYNYWYLRTDDPMLSWLGQRRLLDPALVEPQLRDRIFHWPIGYIVIHEDSIGLDSATNQEIIGYFNSLPDLLCPYTVEGHAVVYRTIWHPDGCPARTPPEIKPGVYQIDIGAAGDERFIGWGWHYAENIAGVPLRWTGEYPQTLIYADLPPGAYDVTISAQAFAIPRTLRLLVNGKPVDDTVTVPVGILTPFTFRVPAEAIGSGQHLTLALDYDGWTVPAQIGQSGDQRKLAIAVNWIRFARQGN